MCWRGVLFGVLSFAARCFDDRSGTPRGCGGEGEQLAVAATLFWQPQNVTLNCEGNCQRAFGKYIEVRLLCMSVVL
ncbi:hypothetical protein B0H63DRAFT_488008 [Podospora didyma]|uniref:Secreted protein n=1 Tax=Podospora didyma TaxID=330526 RepID=A0AAE0K2H0_9PEZI|nr:hypothetical protein B0H63DRAFT_488008 [Podospora didyma]